MLPGLNLELLIPFSLLEIQSPLNLHNTFLNKPSGFIIMLVVGLPYDPSCRPSVGRSVLNYFLKSWEVTLQCAPIGALVSLKMDCTRQTRLPFTRISAKWWEGNHPSAVNPADWLWMVRCLLDPSGALFRNWYFALKNNMGTLLHSSSCSLDKLELDRGKLWSVSERGKRGLTVMLCI